MKKAIITSVFALVIVFGLFANSDPFATRRFLNNDFEISFRVQDSEGRPQVKYVRGESVSQCYYNFDDNYIVLYDEKENPIEVFGYSFINNGESIRLFEDNGKFHDLASDNGKTGGDKIWEAVDTVMQNFLIYGGSGALVGAAFSPIGAAIGLCAGGVFGIGKAFVHNIFGWV